MPLKLPVSRQGAVRNGLILYIIGFHVFIFGFYGTGQYRNNVEMLGKSDEDDFALRDVSPQEIGAILDNATSKFPFAYPNGIGFAENLIPGYYKLERFEQNGIAFAMSEGLTAAQIASSTGPASFLNVTLTSKHNYQYAYTADGMPSVTVRFGANGRSSVGTQPDGRVFLVNNALLGDNVLSTQKHFVNGDRHFQTTFFAAVEAKVVQLLAPRGGVATLSAYVMRRITAPVDNTTTTPSSASTASTTYKASV